MTAPAIAVENLTRTFVVPRGLRGLLRPAGSEVLHALRGLSLEVQRGEIVGLLGPNGAGKTTLLEILATHLLPTGGRAWLNGRDVIREPLAVRREVGYCPAGPGGFYPSLRGKHNLEFFAVLNRLPRAQIGQRLERLWSLVGLDGFIDLPVGRYSDGMRQRLALARALLADPSVLLLDEPTRGVDPDTAAAWRRFLRGQVVGELGKTILLVTHDMLEARICDRVTILARGAVTAEGRAKEVLDARVGNGLDLLPA